MSGPGSYFRPPAATWRLEDPQVWMHATPEQRRVHAKMLAWKAYPRAPPSKVALLHEGALDVCNVVCARCRRDARWDVVKHARHCAHCGVPYWPPGVWEGASVYLRLTGDFDTFNAALRRGLGT